MTTVGGRGPKNRENCGRLSWTAPWLALKQQWLYSFKCEHVKVIFMRVMTIFYGRTRIKVHRVIVKKTKNS
jgi:hypothetical protein